MIIKEEVRVIITLENKSDINSLFEACNDIANLLSVSHPGYENIIRVKSALERYAD